jgi:eukaryotic-like serine/threonine-protein kinase
MGAFWGPGRVGMKPVKSGDPDKIGGIALGGRLGEGGMGTVYFGVTPDGDRVAVKTIREGLTANQEAKDRFDREILVLGMVAGPRIAALLLASDPDEVPPWFATEYVRGLTLSEYVQERGPLTTAMAAALGVMLAEGLTDIHAAGLLHRDLKPSNVILGADGPRVIDFGLAGLADGGGDITHTSGMVGTPVCMAPEQARSPRDLTAAVDVYALGAVLMFAMTGRYPYERPSVPALLVALTDPATDPDLTGLPEEIRQLVTGMLAYHPESRRTLADAWGQLRHILDRAGLSPAEAQREFAHLTYIERGSDPLPAAPAPRRDRRRLPGNPHVPSGIVRQVGENLRREYARGAVL